MKITTKKLVTAGVLLALMIVSQFFKNLSVYITGPIVNTILLLATLSCGLLIGIILCVIAPITSFIITGSPIVAAAPFLMIPAIAVGNIIICITAYFFYTKFKKGWALPTGLLLGSIFKALFMGAVISNFILVQFVTSLPEIVISVAKKTFSITQLTTSIIGSILFYVIWMAAGKYLKNEVDK